MLSDWLKLADVLIFSDSDKLILSDILSEVLIDSDIDSEVLILSLKL